MFTIIASAQKKTINLNMALYSVLENLRALSEDLRAVTDSTDNADDDYIDDSGEADSTDNADDDYIDEDYDYFDDEEEEISAQGDNVSDKDGSIQIFDDDLDLDDLQECDFLALMDKKLDFDNLSSEKLKIVIGKCIEHRRNLDQVTEKISQILLKRLK